MCGWVQPQCEAASLSGGRDAFNVCEMVECHADVGAVPPGCTAALGCTLWRRLAPAAGVPPRSAPPPTAAPGARKASRPAASRSSPVVARRRASAPNQHKNNTNTDTIEIDHARTCTTPAVGASALGVMTSSLIPASTLVLPTLASADACAVDTNPTPSLHSRTRPASDGVLQPAPLRQRGGKRTRWGERAREHARQVACRPEGTSRGTAPDTQTGTHLRPADAAPSSKLTSARSERARSRRSEEAQEVRVPMRSVCGPCCTRWTHAASAPDRSPRVVSAVQASGYARLRRIATLRCAGWRVPSTRCCGTLSSTHSADWVPAACGGDRRWAGLVVTGTGR